MRQAARSAEDEAARHARLRARRFARTRTDTDGLVIVHAGFAPKDWAPFAERLRRGTDAEFTRARRDGRRDNLDAYAADALLAMLTHGTGTATRPGPPRLRRATTPPTAVTAGCGRHDRTPTPPPTPTADPPTRPEPNRRDRRDPRCWSWSMASP